ncbi:MAG: PAS domain-containing protein [Cetobacterium sp.]|uniref:PAS domain-containing protein n=1 Tax=Cetobacterium sp. TaxID=2071632 RepID=UPI003F3F135B
MDNIPYMAWFKNKSSQYMIVNNEFKEHCGKDFDTIRGKDDQFVWDGMIGENYREYDLKVMTERKQLIFDEIIPGKKGYK